jgi:hypothetical protein
MDSIYFERIETDGKVTLMKIDPQFTEKISFDYAESIMDKLVSLREIPAMMVQDKVSLFIGAMINTWNDSSCYILHDKF